MYEFPKVLRVASSILSVYPAIPREDGTKLERHFLSRIAEIEFFILVLGAISRNARIRAASQLSSARMNKHCKDYAHYLVFHLE